MAKSLTNPPWLSSSQLWQLYLILASPARKLCP